MPKIRMNIPLTDKAIKEAFEDFILDCKIRNLSPFTIKHHTEIYKNLFLKVFDENMKLSEFNEDSIRKYIEYLQSRGQKDITIATNLKSARIFLYWCMRKGYMRKFKIPEYKTIEPVIETYTDEELRKLLKKPNLKTCTFGEYRSWVIVNFILATGARLQTIANLKVKDLDFESETIRFNTVKNRKQQIIPMAKSLIPILKEYLSIRKPTSSEDYVFVNINGGKLTNERISHTLNYYNKDRGVQKTGVHRFRHTFAKHWILNNGDIFTLQKMLGHSDLDIVKRYVNMFADDMRKNFEVVNPLEKFKNQRIKMPKKGGKQT